MHVDIVRQTDIHTCHNTESKTLIVYDILHGKRSHSVGYTMYKMYYFPAQTKVIDDNGNTINNRHKNS